MKKSLLFKIFALVAAMMCALGVQAQEAYACYTPSNTTLKFYYDTQRDSRPGTTYSMPSITTLTPGWYSDGSYANVTHAVFDSSFAGYRPTYTYGWFQGMNKLQDITGMIYLKTDNVLDMRYMFQSCSKLTSLDVSHFNTAKVTTMNQMFRGCSGLTSLDLSSFNTSKVTNMASMFYACTNLTTIYVGSGWSTVAVTNSTNMFTACSSLVGGKGTTYDANHVDAAYAHLDGGPTNPGYFTTAGTQAYACFTPGNTTLTFYYDTQRSSRPGWKYDLNTGIDNTDWLTDETNAEVTQVVFDPSFAAARPLTTYVWFYKMQNLQTIEGIEYLNTSKVTNMGWMFGYCKSLTSLDLSHFKTSKVTSMAYMFAYSSGLTSLDLSSFSTSNVTNMSNMFKGCSGLMSIYVGDEWSTAAVTSSQNMFVDDSSLMGGKGTTYDANHVDATYAHLDGGPSNPGYFTAAGTEAYACYTPSNTTLTFYYDNQRSNRPGTTYDMNTDNNSPGWFSVSDGTNANVTRVVFDPSFAGARPTSACQWFSFMENLQTIEGIEYLNTSEMINMAWMFTYCTELTSLDLSHFNTSKVDDMREMFYHCDNLMSLDLSSFNTSQVAVMSRMFYKCGSLRTITVGSDWSTEAVEFSTNMFADDYNLVGGQGTAYDDIHLDKNYAHIDGGPSNPGYLTAAGTQAYACYTPENTTLTFYHDNQRSDRTGTTYDLNTGTNDTGWETDGTNANVTKVVFAPSFAGARPTTTNSWFYNMQNLQTIEGIEYLNTSEVTNMAFMFMRCAALTNLDVSHFNTSLVTTMQNMFAYSANLTSLDLSSFNTSQVTSMTGMFRRCDSLRTIYAGDDWSTEAVRYSTNMFGDDTRLVGGMGTTYDANHIDKAYAHIDGGLTNPGYFTEKPTALRGDVNGDNLIDINDVTLLIDVVLGKNVTYNAAGGDCNTEVGDGTIDINDVTTLINRVLTGNW